MVPKNNLDEDNLLKRFEARRRAAIGYRIGAWLVDIAVVVVAALTIIYVLRRYHGRQSIWLEIFIFALTSAGYLIPMTCLAGQTLGKMLLGIRVVDANGLAPGIGSLFFRKTRVIPGAPLIRQRKAALIGAGVWGALVFACIFCIAFIFPGPRPYGPIVQNRPLVSFTAGPIELASNAKVAISQETLDQMRKNAQTNPNDPKALNDGALADYMYGNLDGAEKKLEDALPLAPEDPVIVGNLGRVYYDSGKYDKAISVLQKVHRVAQYAELGLLLANIFIKKGDYNSAENAIRGVPDNKSTRFDINNVLGAIHIGRGLIGMAIEDFQRANRSDPNNAIGLYNMGVSYQGINDLAQAAQYYRSAIDKDPNLAEALFNLATVLALGGKRDEAAIFFNKSTDLFAFNSKPKPISPTPSPLPRSTLVTKQTPSATPSLKPSPSIKEVRDIVGYWQVVSCTASKSTRPGETENCLSEHGDPIPPSFAVRKDNGYYNIPRQITRTSGWLYLFSGLEKTGNNVYTSCVGHINFCTTISLTKDGLLVLNNNSNHFPGYKLRLTARRVR